MKNYDKIFPALSEPTQYENTAPFRVNPALLAAFLKLGCRAELINEYLSVTYKGRSCFLRYAETSFTSLVGSRIFRDKPLSHRLLREAGLEVAEQHLLNPRAYDRAKALVARLGTAVVKPAYGNQGKGVTVGVTPDTLAAAWEASQVKGPSKVLIEAQFSNAIEARYLVIDGKCVAVFQRIPPFLRGDGGRSVQDLLDASNAARQFNPHLVKAPILMDPQRQSFLRMQGFELDSVPRKDQLVILDFKAPVTSGGVTRNITNEVNPGFKRIAERAATIVPGVDIAGIDMLAHDHAAPVTPGSYIIVEVNTRPDLAGHMCPAYGEPLNVCEMLAKSCLAKMVPKERPAAAIDPMSVIACGNNDTRKVGTIVFGGDTCLGYSYLKRKRWADVMERLNTAPHSFFEGLAPLLSDRSALILNLETVLAHEPQDVFGGVKNFLGWDRPDASVDALKTLGVDGVTLANNHALDFGPNHALGTLAHLKRAGIAAAGAGSDLAQAAQPLAINAGGNRVLVFPAFENLPRYDEVYSFYAAQEKPGVVGVDWPGSADIFAHIAAFRATNPRDFIVFAPHWGGVHNYRWSNKGMARIGAKALKSGADLVMGHGAHCLQELAFAPTGSIAFSLGNFVFNSPGRFAAKGGFPYSLVSRLTLENGSAGLRLYPISCDNRVTGFRSRPVTAEQMGEVGSTLRARSSSPQHFDETVEIGYDTHGWYLENRKALSPRFAKL